MSSDAHPPALQRYLIGFTLFALLIAAVIAGVFLQPGPLRFAGDDTAIPSDQARALLERLHVGTALLENGRYLDCQAAFVELSRALPREPLGPLNLAIARLLAAETAEAEARAKLLSGAAEALEMLSPRLGASAVAHRLRARLHELSGNDAAAYDELANAFRLEPDDPRLAFQVYQFGERLSDETTAAAMEALGRAYDLSPENLHVLAAWLAELAEAEDPRFVAVLAASKKTLAPFASLYDRLNFAFEQSLDEARTHAENGRWRQAWLLVKRLTILLHSDVAWGLDGRRIDPHLLEYAALDFGPAFAERAGPLRPEPPEPVAVRFVRAPEAAQPPALPVPEQPLPEDATSGVAIADFDLDGRLDIIVGVGNRIEVYGRPPEAAGGWTSLASLELPRAVAGVLAYDLDRDDTENAARQAFDVVSTNEGAAAAGTDCVDADVDLIAWGPGGVFILRNQLNAETGERTLEPVAQDEAFDALRDVLGCCAADIDHDGDLDLVVSTAEAISVWSNRDDFTFEEITNRSALPPAGLGTRVLLPIDWDRTVSLDVIVGGTSAGILENILHGRLRWREFGDEFAALAGAKSLKPIDADANVSWDFVAGGTNGIRYVSTRTPVPGVVRVEESLVIDPQPVDGLATWDFDNDGRLDLVAWGAERIDIYRATPRAHGPEPVGFVKMDDLLPADDFQNVRACHPADLDGDGDLDLLVHSAAGLTWLVNEGGNARPWLNLAIRGDPDKSPQRKSERCNIHGIGSLLELKAGDVYLPRVVDSQFTHFGLGTKERADIVRILWTNGIPQNVLEPVANQTVCAQQKLLGSCPYLYTWTGERYEFFTDCLWAAPLGLPFSESTLAPIRDWEYLKIPGETLVPIDGEYRLQMTEELWEAAYFDTVRLIAIDHPADVDVYSNEKVGPPEIAEFKVHTVRQPRLPVAARDQRGRDLMDLIREQDGVFARAFAHWHKQGLTEEHFLELDLGPLGATPPDPLLVRGGAENGDAAKVPPLTKGGPGGVTLFLTGWVFPTDSSLNIAIAQNPALDPPQPPSLWVPDETGQWQKVMPFIGFPGGKTKTIAIDLSKAFLTDDYRLRIVTSMEICWDNAFFTVDEQPAEYRLIEIAPSAADLHYRGFSQIVPRPGNAPDHYDYARVDTAPQWPPMIGGFTRYGDATDLVREEDDRLVVLAAGDELTVRFSVPAEDPPPGWKRDFFLHNVGWDKDANLNTVGGQMVGPMPFRRMPRYPFAGDALAPPLTKGGPGGVADPHNRPQDAAAFWRFVRDYGR
ncbi:MAG: CRTAC1 family protein [Planctomycetes bacterium]|nr:CRTAC1 family protein [Planctomycetota bacterium]